MLSRTITVLNRQLKTINNKNCTRHCSQVQNAATEKVSSYQLPEKYKGTFVERWFKYWKNLYKDYEDVAIDIYKDCKLHPIKASVYATLMGSCYYLAKHNPDEVAFREQLLSSASKVLQIGQPIRNPVTTYYLKWVEQCHNEGLIRRLNFGIFSVLWLHDYDKDCKIYKATCSYLKPRYLTFHTRIIDIGFLDNWWVLENSMINYDINETEFNENAYA